MSCGCRIAVAHYGGPDEIEYCPLHGSAEKLLEAARAAKKYLEPDLVEPGRTVFWNLVDAIQSASSSTDLGQVSNRQVRGMRSE